MLYRQTETQVPYSPVLPNSRTCFLLILLLRFLCYYFHFLIQLCVLFVLLMQTITDLFALFPYNFHYSLWAILSVTYHSALCFGFHPLLPTLLLLFSTFSKNLCFPLRDAFSFCQTLYEKHGIPLSVPEEWKKHIPRWYQNLVVSILLGNIEFHYFSERRGACQCLSTENILCLTLSSLT